MSSPTPILPPPRECWRYAWAWPTTQGSPWVLKRSDAVVQASGWAGAQKGFDRYHKSIGGGGIAQTLMRRGIALLPSRRGLRFSDDEWQHRVEHLERDLHRASTQGLRVYDVETGRYDRINTLVQLPSPADLERLRRWWATGWVGAIWLPPHRALEQLELDLEHVSSGCSPWPGRDTLSQTWIEISPDHPDPSRAWRLCVDALLHAAEYTP